MNVVGVVGAVALLAVLACEREAPKATASSLYSPCAGSDSVSGTTVPCVFSDSVSGTTASVAAVFRAGTSTLPYSALSVVCRNPTTGATAACRLAVLVTPGTGSTSNLTAPDDSVSGTTGRTGGDSTK